MQAIRESNSLEKVVIHILRQVVIDYWSQDEEIKSEARKFVHSMSFEWLEDFLEVSPELLRHRITSGQVDLKSMKWKHHK